MYSGELTSDQAPGLEATTTNLDIKISPLLEILYGVANWNLSSLRSSPAAAKNIHRTFFDTRLRLVAAGSIPVICYQY